MEPVEGQVPTPAAPTNPFSGTGTTGNIDRNKVLLNEIISMGGTRAESLYNEQDARTQEALRQRLAGASNMPAAQQAIYDGFRRDAEEARRQHAESQQRQSQLGSIFMDQAKAAVPIYEKNVDAQTEALRMQYEAQARRDAEAAAASAARSSGGGGGSSYKATDYGDVATTALTPEQAVKAGTAGAARSVDQALAAYGVQNPAVSAKYGPALQKVASVIANASQAKGTKALSFDAVMGTIDDMLSEMQASGDIPEGTNPSFLRDVALYMFAPVWGVQDTDWGFQAGAYRQLNAMNSNNAPTPAQAQPQGSLAKGVSVGAGIAKKLAASLKKK